MSEIERRKKIWVAIGKWMETSTADEELPSFPDFTYSSSEKMLIKVTLELTTKKRIELIRSEWRVIKPDEPGYAWSDLITIPDIEREAMKQMCIELSTWINQTLPQLLRMKPMSMAMRNKLDLHKVLLGSMDVALSGLDAYIKEDSKIKRKSASHAAKSRHENSKLAAELNDIEGMWHEWKMEPDSGMSYKNNTDFAEEVCRAYKGLKIRTMLDKCTEWSKKYDYINKRGRPRKK